MSRKTGIDTRLPVDLVVNLRACSTQNIPPVLPAVRASPPEDADCTERLLRTYTKLTMSWEAFDLGSAVQQMDLRKVPERIFLDTSVVNFILDYGEQIFDGSEPPTSASERVVRDIEALSNIMLVGKRAMWQLAISPHTYQEIMDTRDKQRRDRLRSWFEDLWRYWLGIIHENDDLPSFIEAEQARVSLLASGSLDVLSDVKDRVLVCDAIVYRCELFCTRDWKTILKHRDDLKGLPLSIATPVEWWSEIRPYTGLWV